MTKKMDNPETLSTFGTQDTGWRTNKAKKQQNIAQKIKNWTPGVPPPQKKTGVNPGTRAVLLIYTGKSGKSRTKTPWQIWTGPSLSWSYLSWIYNYLYKQCLSPLKLWLVTNLWFSPCTLVSSTNKTDRHDITEILLKVTLHTIALTNPMYELIKSKCKRLVSTHNIGTDGRTDEWPKERNDGGPMTILYIYHTTTVMV